MIRYAIRYQDSDGYGWTMEVDASDPGQAISKAAAEPDVVRIVSVLPLSHLISFS